MSDNPWGEAETQFFFNLSPERILEAVEAFGFRCTGRFMPLNSLENRVYQVEIEIQDHHKIASPSERYRVVKFYRPGRWSRAQIEEEHEFITQLQEHEIPVVSPLPAKCGQTIIKAPGLEILCGLWPMIGGRAPDELSTDNLIRIGRLLGRIHRVGKSRQAHHRVQLNPENFGRKNLNYLVESKVISNQYAQEYSDLAKEIFEIIEPLWRNISLQRIHGDCHSGNLLWNDKGPFWVDFDDMVVGPAVQDIWLLVAGRDQESQLKIEALLSGYQEMNEFDRSTLRLIEPLRTLRFINFSAWISKRWYDPAFSANFPDFGSERYWSEQTKDLRDQLNLMRNIEIKG